MHADGNLIPTNPRLLIILNRFVIGGQAVDTIPLAWHLKDNFEILILYGEKEKDEVEPTFLLKKYPGLRLKKLKYLRRSVNPIIDFLAFFSVLHSIIIFRANVVHTHGAKSGFIGRIAAWLCRVPIVIHSFHGHLFHSYFSKKVSSFIAFAERLAGKMTTAVIALSSAQKSELAYEFKILPAEKIHIIQLGFDFDNSIDPSFIRTAFRKRYNLQPPDVAIGIVGRIVPVKNHSFFVQVMKNVLAADTKNPPVFFIIGDGELRSQTEQELTALGISFSNNSATDNVRVVFTSWLTDMFEVMNGLDVVALTSLNEGTPLSIIEAQFCARPIVSTDVGGVKDTMQDRTTGFLVEKTDVKTFSDKLLLLIENKGLRTSMGAKGNEFVRERFSKQNEIALTKQLYFTLLLQKGYRVN